MFYASHGISVPEEDLAAVREVVYRKAAAFWIEGTPRTTLKHLLHDTIPTGPPVRTPPHHLRGEEADWVDSQLQSHLMLILNTMRSCKMILLRALISENQSR